MIKMEVQGVMRSRQEAARLERFIIMGIDRATMQEAHELRKEIVIGLRDQSPGGKAILPLAETTIYLRGLPKSGGGGRSGSRRGGRRGNFRDKGGRWRDRHGRYLSKTKRRGRRRGALRHNVQGPLARGQKRKKSPRRGPSKALINRGDLIGGVNVRRVSWGHYTVGVHRGERGKKGGHDLVNIAEIHEYGTKTYTVTVTEKMAKFSRFLCVMGILAVPWKIGQRLKKKIDARPFLNPAHDAWELNAADRFGVRLNFALTGKII